MIVMNAAVMFAKMTCALKSFDGVVIISSLVCLNNDSCSDLKVAVARSELIL